MPTRWIIAVSFVAAAGCGSVDHAPPPDATLNIPQAQTHPTNTALFAYLGEPVPWPANVDPAFTADGHRRALAAACTKIGADLRRIEVDTSEFPPVFGVEFAYARAEDDADTFGAALPPPYEWSGCTSTTWHESGRRMTRIVTCVVPLDAVPAAHMESAHRRQGVRTQRLMESMGASADGPEQ